jgi:hypothetical protein
VVKTATTASKSLEVKSLEEMGKVLKELQPGEPVTVKFEGKEIVLETKSK